MSGERIEEHDARLETLERGQKEILSMLKENTKIIDNLTSKKNESVFLFVISFCCVSILLITSVLTWLGIIDLRIVGQIEFSKTTEYLGNLLMFMLNMFFVFSVSLRLFDKRIVPLWIGYLPVYIIISIAGSPSTGLLFGTIPPLFYAVIIGAITHKSRPTAIVFRYLIFAIITYLYQLISGYIKIFGFGFNYNNCNIAVMFIYSIDLYLYYIISLKVVKSYVGPRKMANRWTRLARKACREILANREVEDVSGLTKRQRRIFYILAWAYLILQSFTVIGVNVLINKFFRHLGGFYMGAIELFISWAALELFRLALGKTYHAPPAKCNIISLLIFFGISRLGLPLHISLFFNIGLSAGLAYALHAFVLRNDELIDLRSAAHKHNSFSLKTCTEEQLRERCRLSGFSKEDTDLSIKLFVNKDKIKEVASEMHLEEQSMKNKKSKLAKQLNSTF